MKKRNQRIATSRDVKFITHLAKRFANELGFIPFEGLQKRIDLSQCILGLENEEPAGYVLAPLKLATAPIVRPIFQAAVCMDAQRRRLGLMLIDRVCREAKDAGQSIVQCWCREDLEANEFWKIAGFEAVALRATATARKRACILWRKPVSIVSPDLLHQRPQTSRVQGPGGLWMKGTHDVSPVTYHQLSHDQRPKFLSR